MIRYIFLGMLMLGWSAMALGQQITILDKQTGEALPFVTITSQDSRAQATSDAQGQANFTPFQGAQVIEFRMMGYRTRTLSYVQLKRQGFSLKMTPSNIALQELVVSATRWKQEADDIPAKVTAISAEEAAMQNPQTAADLLGISGEVFVQKSQQGGGSPMIRGFATNRLLYTVDGVRMNTAIFRGGNIQNVINIDPFATESTEILFGPGSVIYGSDAIGGVMSFQTLTPRLSDSDTLAVSGKAIARYSSANQENTGHFDVSIGGKKWAAVTSFSAWDYDHLRQGRHGPEEYLKHYYVQLRDSSDQVVQQEDELLQRPSAYSQWNMMQKIRFSPNARWDFQYAFHYSTTSPYGRYDRHNRMRKDKPRYGQWDYGPQKWRMHYFSATHSAARGIYDEVDLRIASQAFEESRLSRDLNSPDREVREERVDAYSVNLDLKKSLSPRSTLYYGVEFIQNDVDSEGRMEDIFTGGSQAGPDRYPQASWNSLAIYLNEEWKASEQLTLQGGLRYNRFLLDATFDTTFYPFPFSEASINNGALTGSLGAVFRPSEDWVLNVNFGTAFRSPNVDDIGKVFDSEPGAVVVPNPDLEAEYAYNLDIGLAKTFGENLKIDATAYYTLLRNALARRNFQLNGQDSIVYDGVLSQVQAIQNVAEARVYGLQFGFEWQMSRGFRLSSNINYQKGEEELENGEAAPTRHAAPMFGVTRLRYKIKKLRLELNAQYQGEQSHEDLAFGERGKEEIYAKDDQGRTYAPAWYTLNFKAQYQFSPNFSLNAGMENITDQRYRPYSSGISGAGRNFVLSMQGRF